jgi:hypothetical protein
VKAMWGGDEQRLFARPSSERQKGIPHRIPFQKKRVSSRGWSYTDIPLDMKPHIARKREHRRALQSHVDARVCFHCRYAFISLGGHNLCGPCWRMFWNQYATVPERYRLNLNPKAFFAWVRERCPDANQLRWNPWYPIPDLNRDKVQEAVRSMLERMGEQVRLDRWIVGSMPRLEPWLYYPDAPRVKSSKSPRGLYSARVPWNKGKKRPIDHWTRRVCADPPGM